MITFHLASASPRRHEILQNLGFKFTVMRAPVIDEDEILNDTNLSPVEIAKLTSHNKSLTLDLKPDQIALTADTVVAIDDKTFGKPKDDHEAQEFLRALSGKRHDVITAITLRKGKSEPVTDYESTAVYFTEMSEDDIKWYVSTGEPFGKAGAYAIQGFGGFFIERIDGCYFNVVGLPVFKLIWLLGKMEYDYRDFIVQDGGSR
jgi:septum formation protein